MKFLEGVMSTSEVLALVITVVGVLIAFIIRFAVSRIAVAVERRLDSNLRNLPQTIVSGGRFAFWIVVLATLTTVYRILGGDDSLTLPHIVGEYLPKLLVSIVFVGFGHLIGVLFRDIARSGIRDPNLRILTSRLLYFLPLLIGVLGALTTLGLDVSFLITMGTIVSAVVLATMGLAFALGAKDHIANLIARRDLTEFHAGDQVRVGEVEGTVAELTRTSMILNSPQGQIIIPASRVANSVTTRVLSDS